MPAGEKVVRLFEPHTDVIVKGGCATRYDHKIALSTGRRGPVLDVVEDGNPAESALCLPMLKGACGALWSAAVGGGYASRESLEEARALGVEHLVFHKKRGWGSRT